MECGFNLTAPGLLSAGTLARAAPSLTAVRCPRVSVHHRNKAACGLVVLQATSLSTSRADLFNLLVR